MQVLVRDNNIDQALRVLKKKMQREGVFREMTRRRFYEKPSEQAAREKSEAVRRLRKLARKQAVREGLIAAPKKKPAPLRRGAAALPPTQTPHIRRHGATQYKSEGDLHDLQGKSRTPFQTGATIRWP